MLKSLAFVLALASGCATSDRVALVASVAAIACDMAQTTESASEHWRFAVEDNPIIHGRGPTAIVGYAAVVTALHIGVWYLLPKGWRTVYGAGWTAAEIYAVNYSAHRKYVCGGPISNLPYGAQQ